MGGFTRKSPEELYRRWVPFGMLTSHSRCHGDPPKEPWEYSDDFKNVFKKSVELKYALFPYIKEQSQLSAKNGFPLMRTLFFEYPQDPIAWDIEDEYLFGEKILVAPLFKQNQTGKKVYLPAGEWVNYFDKTKAYTGGTYHHVSQTDLPILVFVKKGATITHAPIAECMTKIDWSKVYDVRY